MIAAGAWARSRGQLYRCLASTFLRPPGDTLVAPFLDGAILAALDGRFGDDAVAELDRFRQDFDGDYEALDQEYQSLFVVPLGRYVTPYEAVYRDERVVEDEVVRGLLMGPSTVAVTALYREAGVNPVGCLIPMLVQFPIWIALYQVIRLSLGDTPESLVTLSGRLYPIPFIHQAVPLNNGLLYWNLGQPDTSYVLPFIVAASMYVQQKLITPTPTAATAISADFPTS